MNESFRKNNAAKKKLEEQKPLYQTAKYVKRNLFESQIKLKDMGGLDSDDESHTSTHKKKKSITEKPTRMDKKIIIDSVKNQKNDDYVPVANPYVQ